MKWLVALALAACGDNAAHHTDAASPADAPIGCTATFSGNFSETSTGDADCPTLSGTKLQLSLPSQTLMTHLAIVLDLGVVDTGSYSEQTIALWNAAATQTVGPGACYYIAGSESSPHGSFQLALTSIAPLHGHLTILQYVLARAFTDCGGGNTENVDVTF